MTAPGRLAEVSRAFLRLGATAFGGPAAHIALMHDEFVRRRGWVSEQEYVDAVSAANLIPGPNSTEVAMHIGHRRAGSAGLVLAGVGFILPAALLVTAIAAWYVNGASVPATSRALAAVQPVVMVVLLQALAAFARTTLKSTMAWVIAITAIMLAARGTPELVVLGTGGLVGFLLAASRQRGAAAGPDARQMVGAALAFGGVVPAAVPASLATLFLATLKIGSVLFGSGYVLLAFLRTEFVERLHWITPAQLLDAVAVGQLTPGPLFTAATFVGYLVAGGPGAAIATIGIFLPAFVLVAFSARLLPYVRRHRALAAALDGVNAASLALLAIVLVHLLPAALARPPQWGIAAVAAALAWGARVPVWAIVTGAALSGLLFGT